jgi:deazaflavin-dependent oxidoreductase (nitroreductase family)
MTTLDPSGPPPAPPTVNGVSHLPPHVQRALARPHRIDITTTGRQTGQPRRIELVFHVIEGRIFISGMPGRRDWYANLVANPVMTFHLTGPVQADLPARARPIIEPTERRQIMEAVTRNWQAEDRFDTFYQRAPLIEVTFPETTVAGAA